MANDRAFSRFGAKVADLEVAWRDRLVDADILKASARFPAAVSYGLYALEILLKVRICFRLDLDELPKPFEIHDLSGLLVLAGFHKKMDADENLPVRMNWDKINDTSNKSNDFRYGPNGAMEEEKANQFFYQLNDPEKGVIPWISSQP